LLHRYLDQPMDKAARAWFIDLDQRPAEWNAPFPPEQLAYAAADVRLLPALYEAQLEQLRERGTTQVAKLEMRALPAIAAMEGAGVKVDVEGWRAFIAEKQTEAAEIESQALAVFGAAILQARTQVFDAKLAEYQAWEQAKTTEEARLRTVFDEGITPTNEYQPPKWGEFKLAGMHVWRENHPNPGKPKPDTSLPNLSSPTQLLQAFTQMGIPVVSTASEVLQALEDDHPEVKLLLDYRKATKFVTSFGEALLQYVFEGRISPEYVQIGASTGRMSCTRPNWQQVPSKGDGKKLRALVIAEPGNKLLTADFSNIELRILADITGDATMLRLFREGLDLHSYTARMMFGLGEDVDVEHALLPGSDVTYRATAKVINFGLVYGMSPVKLGRTVKVPKERAQELMAAYFRLYPGVAEWMERMQQEALDTLRSVTLSGRKRFYALPSGPKSNAPADVNQWRDETRIARSRIRRQGMNTPIQGTSADITKLALALLYEKRLLQNGMDLARIVAVVHDEIVLECAAEMADLVARQLAEAMETAAKTYLKRVTLPPVEVVISDHWSKE
jgi:DNA polymerase-1